MTYSELSPQQQLDADTAEMVRLRERADAATNPLMRGILRARAWYAECLLNEDTVAVEVAEYEAQHPAQSS